jgi:hypothetical protein
VSYLFIAIIWLNHHHLLRFVDHTTPALIWVRGVARSLCDRVDCAHAVGFGSRGCLRRDLCLREHRVFGVRATSAWPGGPHTAAATRQAHSKMSILRHPVDFHERDGGGSVRAARRFRPDLLRPAPLPDAGGTWRSAVSAPAHNSSRARQIVPRRAKGRLCATDNNLYRTFNTVTVSEGGTQ